ncbi:Hypothetical protein EAG7_01308 [Klebsiella aerogenes]|nr:Hypothetical protein EAG7_01308 [Klebsiella aerogenes]CCG29763.1 hypothetical protein [Klebsiella aerogenes EA1509E]
MFGSIFWRKNKNMTGKGSKKVLTDTYAAPLKQSKIYF